MLATQLSERERRTDDRFDVRLDATIRAYRMAPLSALLIDISTGGAMLEAKHGALTIGDEVLLEAGSIEVVATIAWAREAFVGLSFHRRLNPRQLDALRRSGNA